ncbi:MAG: prepilin-type N-terminal cleavage/methylation domain-containing protein [Bacilli bacterium]|jgi:prepilin-type N-terminal cleavage/methylation domain-containing protein|nr:prepilin-type N-terminal cleavage/methylation domain-containing protein [Mollicutes bacterium]
MKKGFTLVEVLGVLVILTIIFAVTIPLVINNVNNTKEKVWEQTVAHIKEGTKLYLREYKEDFPDLNVVGSTIEVSLSEIIDNGFMKPPIINPITDQTVLDSTIINIEVISINNYEITIPTFIYQ